MIDAVYMPSRQSIICSMDPIRLPFSASDGEIPEKQISRPTISVLQITQNGWSLNDSSGNDIATSMQEALKNQKSSPDQTAAKGQSYREILYSLENLRKRGSEE